MATTKIWSIKDSLSRVVDYASNPEKTIFEDLKQVLLYAGNKEKTVDEKEKSMYVTGVNCKAETAFEEMSYIQKKYDKVDGNVAYHAYQSFKTGEVTPELAHRIGVELAEKMWSEHQVLVATHFNTGTYHNHFVVCSVNMFNGKKFNCNKGAYYRFRGLSDEICATNNLTVIKNPKGITPRNIYFAEKRGEPTKYNLMRKAIDEAMEMCVSYEQFKKVMFKKGYIINDDYNRKYPTIRSINDKKNVRMYRLGEKYTPENIERKLIYNPCYMQDGYLRLFAKRKPKKYKKYKYKGNFKGMKKHTSLEILFFIFFQMLGLRRNNITKKAPLSPEMKAEIRKLERYSNEVRLIDKKKFKTINEIEQYISNEENEINKIFELRQKCRNKLRHCTSEVLEQKYKNERDFYTRDLNIRRKDLQTAKQILEDVPKIKQIMKIEQEMRKDDLDPNRTKKKYRDREER